MNKGHTASAPFPGPTSGTSRGHWPEHPGRPVLQVGLRLVGKPAPDSQGFHLAGWVEGTGRRQYGHLRWVLHR